jgi:hypothetical protein
MQSARYQANAGALRHGSAGLRRRPHRRRCSASRRHAGASSGMSREPPADSSAPSSAQAAACSHGSAHSSSASAEADGATRPGASRAEDARGGEREEQGPQHRRHVHPLDSRRLGRDNCAKLEAQSIPGPLVRVRVLHVWMFRRGPHPRRLGAACAWRPAAAPGPAPARRPRSRRPPAAPPARRAAPPAPAISPSTGQEQNGAVGAARVHGRPVWLWRWAIGWVRAGGLMKGGCWAASPGLGSRAGCGGLGWAHVQGVADSGPAAHGAGTGGGGGGPC